MARYIGPKSKIARKFKSLGFEITSTTKDFMKFHDETWDCYEMKLKDM